MFGVKCGFCVVSYLLHPYFYSISSAHQLLNCVEEITCLNANQHTNSGMVGGCVYEGEAGRGEGGEVDEGGEGFGWGRGRRCGIYVG